MCMSSHIHPISPSVINQHSTARGSIISRGGERPPPVDHGVYKTPVDHEGLKKYRMYVTINLFWAYLQAHVPTFSYETKIVP